MPPRRAARAWAGAFALAVAFCAVLLGRTGPAGEAVDPPRAQEQLPLESRVARIIDGDTVELQGGRRVRYIGVDTPESRRQDRGRWLEDPEPFAKEATEANRRLVEDRAVRLEYDVQTHDRYGRLLAYVYVGELMVNEQLLRDGMAQTLTIPPNVRYAERFRTASAEAREAGRGLWSVRARGPGSRTRP